MTTKNRYDRTFDRAVARGFNHTEATCLATYDVARQEGLSHADAAARALRKGGNFSPAAIEVWHNACKVL